MTNTEAITKLTNIMHDDHYAWSPTVLTAFGMAVDALKGVETGRTKTRDVVDREDVIKAIIMCAEIDPFNRTVRRLPQSWRNSLIMCMGSIPSAQGKPDWIPCSEETGDGYPEEDGFYYVTEQNYGFYLDADCKQRVTHTSHFKNGDFTDRFYTENISNITAWMPLPEPWKEGEQE